MDSTRSLFSRISTALLVACLAMVMLMTSCGYEEGTEEPADTDSNVTAENDSFYAAFCDYYDYACYVIEGDDTHYHHQQCKSIEDEHFSCRIYNLAEVQSQELEPCPECWDLTPDEFLEEHYFASTNEDAYKDAAVEIVGHCAVINKADNRYYHRMRCSTMEGDEEFIILNTEAAEADGYEPCSICWGDENANARIFIINTYTY